MARSHLVHVAESNKSLIINTVIQIPQTIKIEYEKLKLTPSNIINGKVIKTTVLFKTMKTDECAIHCINNNIGTNIVLMNFASRHYHGGGYRRGAKAQEEDLCRVIPALYPSLCGIKYPFEQDSVLLTPHLNILRDNTGYNLFPFGANYHVGVVSAAAQNLRNEKYDEKYDEECVRRTLENMYTAVKYHMPNTDTLIVGAWGCGAYGNDPDRMSRVMNEVNLKYGGLFKTVVFSVPDGVNTKEFRDNITLMTRTD